MKSRDVVGKKITGIVQRRVQTMEGRETEVIALCLDDDSRIVFTAIDTGLDGPIVVVNRYPDPPPYDPRDES